MNMINKHIYIYIYIWYAVLPCRSGACRLRRGGGVVCFSYVSNKHIVRKEQPIISIIMSIMCNLYYTNSNNYKFTNCPLLSLWWLWLLLLLLSLLLPWPALAALAALAVAEADGRFTDVCVCVYIYIYTYRHTCYYIRGGFWEVERGKSPFQPLPTFAGAPLRGQAKIINI